ncbi:MAG: hypothetical protein QOH16_1878 [Gaiellaceae bacterium]|nr:hypothetical protein [Gaiellaceae bacterium]
MDTYAVERVALLSIRPEFAEAIFTGRKVVEFRRSRLAPDINRALVYATSPTARVIGWFSVSGISESTPDGLWRQFRRHGAIRRRDYFDYFEGASRAYGIRIERATRLGEPVLLDALEPGLRAPQSFQYLSASRLDDLVGITAGAPSTIPRPQMRPLFGI